MISAKNILSLPDENQSSIAHSTICVGNIVSITENGQVLVNFSGNSFAPLVARFINLQLPADIKTGETNIPVLLTFDGNDFKSPIIIGCLHETYSSAIDMHASNISTWQSKDIYVDGKKLIINAQEEIILKCGKSSLSLRKDGKIVLKGAQLISCASDTNKIKGSTVNIN